MIQYEWFPEEQKVLANMAIFTWSLPIAITNLFDKLWNTDKEKHNMRKNICHKH